MRVMLRILTATIGVLLMPLPCFAEDVTSYSFLGADVPGRIEASSALNATPLNDGLHINAVGLGKLTFEVYPDHEYNVISITYVARDVVEPALLWHRRDAPEDELIVAPIVMASSDTTNTVDFDVSRYDQWDERADVIGISFQPGSNLVVKSIDLRGYSLVEQLGSAWQTFWTFDRFRPSGINFVWGPLLTFSPVARAQLFYNIPPVALSANWFFYGVIILITLGALVWTSVRPRSYAFSSVILITIASLWVIYDVRMGSEFFSYLSRDYRTYWSKPIGERTLREREFFYDFAQATGEALSAYDSYVFVADQRWPYLGLMRYYSYPSIPVEPGNSDAPVWVVYNRPDIVVNDNGQIVLAVGISSPPGRVVHTFAPGTFIFEIDS